MFIVLFGRAFYGQSVMIWEATRSVGPFPTRHEATQYLIKLGYGISGDRLTYCEEPLYRIERTGWEGQFVKDGLAMILPLADPKA